MSYNVVMPHLGLTMEEGSVVSWKKQLGEHVDKGEVLFTVETDKAEMEVESNDTGYLNSIHVELGEKVPVGSVIAILGDGPASVTAVSPSPVATAVSTSEAAGPVREPAAEGRGSASSDDKPFKKMSPPAEYVASPRARRLAEKLGIDIAQVRPLRNQRIVEEDVRRFQSSRQQVDASPSSPEPNSPAASLSSRAATARKIVAKRTAQSFHTAPHFYLGAEANASDLIRLREQLLEPCNRQTGVRLTYTDFFLRAMALGLKEHPEVNAYWLDDDVHLRDSIDIGFAVQTAAGLLVPVIRKADRPLFDLARQRHALAEKAKAQKLTLPEMEGGGATLSNLGGSGVDWFQAILNPPESVILATGRIAKRAAVVQDRLEVCPTVVLSLSVDHRVLDGVVGSNFLRRIKEVIENPALMLL